MLDINLEWDANALAAPQSFRDGVQAAANILDAAIYNSITVNVSIGYGEFGNGFEQLPGGISLGGASSSIVIAYPAVKAALTNNESSSTDVTAFSSLPNTPALSGVTSFTLAPAQAKALGVIPATASGIDGYAGFPSNFTGQTLVSAAIVELIHAMGVLNSGGLLELFEYTSPGNHLLNSGTASTPAYFSIDGGITKLASYDVGFDSTLFSSPTNDPFSVPVSGNLTLTPLDLTELSAVGFDVTSAKAAPTPSITPTVAAAGGSPTLLGQKASVTENSNIAASSLIQSVSQTAGQNIATYSFYDQGNGSGHFVINGVVEPDAQWITVLDTQLGTLQYVGGTSPGSETIEIYASDYTVFGTTDHGFSAVNSTSVGTAIVTTVAPLPPATINNADGTSAYYVYNPTTTATETITKYSGPNAAGTVISNIVDNSDGTASLYAYNPTSTVTLTATQYSSTNTTTGAPTGVALSNVVDNSDGTALLYAYNPTSTVTQTTSKYSSTNASNGAPTGAQISDVVANTDGTALLYAYNPTSTVTQTTSKYSSTDPSNGAPSGAQISDVVDNKDGTAILYAYNPTNTVTQTASYYSSSNASSGAPTGSLTSETIDYTSGQSSITTYAASGTGQTAYFSGPDGTGAALSGLTPAADTSTGLNVAATTNISPLPDVISDGSTVAVIASNQLIDPGTGSHTIQFLPGAASDTLVLHAGASDQVLGFDPTVGDQLDLGALLAEAHVGLDTISQLGSYFSVNAIGAAAQIVFDPTGQGAGTQVALLGGGGAFTTQIQAALIIPHLT